MRRVIKGKFCGETLFATRDVATYTLFLEEKNWEDEDSRIRSENAKVYHFIDKLEHLACPNKNRYM